MKVPQQSLEHKGTWQHKPKEPNWRLAQHSTAHCTQESHTVHTYTRLFLVAAVVCVAGADVPLVIVVPADEVARAVMNKNESLCVSMNAFFLCDVNEYSPPLLPFSLLNIHFATLSHTLTLYTQLPLYLTLLHQWMGVTEAGVKMQSTPERQ